MRSCVMPPLCDEVLRIWTDQIHRCQKWSATYPFESLLSELSLTWDIQMNRMLRVHHTELSGPSLVMAMKVWVLPLSSSARASIGRFSLSSISGKTCRIVWIQSCSLMWELTKLTLVHDGVKFRVLGPLVIQECNLFPAGPGEKSKHDNLRGPLQMCEQFPFRDLAG